MTTELDRLLELKSQSIITLNHEVGLTQSEYDEYQSLKSQIESKLASLQYVDDLINDLGIGKPLDLYLAETKQELSQLRLIVQSIISLSNTDGKNTKISKELFYQRIQSILATSEVKP